MKKRNYIIGETNGEKYILSLTEAEKESIEKIVNLFSNTKFELLEVKEKTDEREEAIKDIACWLKYSNGCGTACDNCEYNNRSISREKARKIAIKHIQGYKKFKEEWLDLLICDEPTSDFLKGYYKAIADVRKRVVEEFNISEVNNGTEID